MSFNDLELGSSGSASSQRPGGSRGGGAPSSGPGKQPGLPLYRDEATSVLPSTFEPLTKRIGIQIFKINSNITAIQKLLTLLSATPPPKQDWTKRIHDLLETTRDLVKDGTGDLKTLASLDIGTEHAQARLTQARLQRDFQASAVLFGRVQKEALDTTRKRLEAEKLHERQQKAQQNQRYSSRSRSSRPDAQLLIDQEDGESQLAKAGAGEHRDGDGNGVGGGVGGGEQVLNLLQQQGPSQADLEYQEQLLESREHEIREIESGVQELNEIFRDLGNIVHEQAGMIDNIEFNINSIAENTAGADQELVTAHEYQRKAGRRCIILILVVGFVVAVVLLAVLN
ncbi:t-SNARE [Testicularia cyperi]|uniref:t-SNARE n=1 Tax=Testicularia cyperi TaxID=1882483 RepID=A0A317XT85_9BASI|nr:t-SNARE [Testicularia cyperi]